MHILLDFFALVGDLDGDAADCKGALRLEPGVLEAEGGGVGDDGAAFVVVVAVAVRFAADQCI